MTKICDYHVHTNYSDDSEYMMEEVVKDAIKKGIDELCFTDHVDYGMKVDPENLTDIQKEELKKDRPFPPFNVEYPVYVEEINRLKKKYQDQITLKTGLEFGMQVHTIEKYRKLFQRFLFDFIILSCHQIEDKEFWTQDFQRGKSQDEYQMRYYQEILNIIKEYKDYSVLGHLDLMKRYDQAGEYPFEKIKDIVSEILTIVIKDKKGIEVNTSSHRYGIHDLTPSRDILKLYKELGGTIITIGSDSHEASHLGAYIEETKKELKDLGFEYYCTFERMEPIFHKL